MGKVTLGGFLQKGFVFFFSSPPSFQHMLTVKMRSGPHRFPVSDKVFS